MAKQPMFQRAMEKPQMKKTWLTLRRGSREKTKMASARLATAAKRGARRKKFTGFEPRVKELRGRRRRCAGVSRSGPKQAGAQAVLPPGLAKLLLHRPLLDAD